MYKLLLSWRYLRTRYIALACIISVTLGVATLVVTNAIMEGFTFAMQDRIHGILSDLQFESQSLEGFPDADARMAEINKVAGEYIEGMSPTVYVPAMLGYTVGSGYMTRQVMVVGVDEATYGKVSDFGQFLQHPQNREKLDFELKEGGYDVYDHQSTEPTPPRVEMRSAGKKYRREMAKFQQRVTVAEGALDANPFAKAEPAETEGSVYDPSKEQHPGAVLGIGLCAYRTLDGGDGFHAIPGDDIEISYPTVGKPPKVLSAKFTVVDFYESKMSDYDSNFVFVPIRKLQDLRGMINPPTGIANVNTIQIRLKPGADLNVVRDLLRDYFPPQLYRISSWRDKEGALLAAVQMELILLNLLLFMIIAVAGFGILAIFFMIVVEKTRDIGILKSLGARGWGILGIFLTYGLSLGIVGAGVGLMIGLMIIHYINEIKDFISWLLGFEIFDPSVYYFRTIPTIVDWMTVSLIVLGSIGIAVAASILPAVRAARLHPVEALRYE